METRSLTRDHASGHGPFHSGDRYERTEGEVQAPQGPVRLSQPRRQQGRRLPAVHAGQAEGDRQRLIPGWDHLGVRRQERVHVQPGSRRDRHRAYRSRAGLVGAVLGTGLSLRPQRRLRDLRPQRHPDRGHPRTSEGGGGGHLRHEGRGVGARADVRGVHGHLVERPEDQARGR